MLIGELAQASGTTTKTLRYYEEAGLVPAPKRTAGGYRDYAPETLARLDFIRRGRVAGLTLAQVRKVLDVRDSGVAPCQHVRDLLDTRRADLDRQITDLQALRDVVVGLRGSATTIEPSTCDPAKVCRYL